VVIREWADRLDFLSVVRLDHGMEGEDYEEIISFHAGVSDHCRMIMWRSAEAVFIQPMIGRG
jgi:hypothetical protein